VTAALRYLLISILLLYAWYMASDTLLDVGVSSSALSLRVSLARPLTWLIVIVTVLCAWGIGKRYAWAWWLALVGVLVQLGRIVWWAVQQHSLPGTGVLLVAGMLAVCLVLLLSGPVRHACTR